MLTPDVRKLIYRHGISTFHDYQTMSLYAGEPFFESGVLAYFDGRLVTLYGFPVLEEQPIKDAFLRRLALCWTLERRAESVLYVGPKPLNLTCLGEHGFRRIEVQPRRVISAELLIDCTDGDIRDRRVYHRSRSMQFKSKVRTGGIVTAEYLTLVEQFYRLREITGYLAAFAFVLPAILHSHRVRIIEARKEGLLRGFLALHKPFKDVVVALFLVHDHQTSGVSDFLYSEMIDYVQRLGASNVNLGPSPSRGHYNFKRKWGGKPVVPPYYVVRWARGLLARRCYSSWGPRLVRLS